MRPGREDCGRLWAYTAAGVDQLVVTPWQIRNPVDALDRTEEYAAAVALASPTAPWSA